MASTKPVLHYFDVGSLGRGEVVRLFLIDAGIEFEDVRYPFDATWPTTSEDLKKKGLSVTGAIPSLEYNGQVLTNHLAILRYFSRELGAYDGDSSYEKYVVDVVADTYVDWREVWVSNLSAGLTDSFKNETVPKYYKTLEHYYSQNTSGPFILGEKISYADFAVYQSLDNNDKIGAVVELPEHLKKLRESIEARPRVAVYLARDRQVKA